MFSARDWFLHRAFQLYEYIRFVARQCTLLKERCNYLMGLVLLVVRTLSIVQQSKPEHGISGAVSATMLR
jgi:hypothetical protein